MIQITAFNKLDSEQYVFRFNNLYEIEKTERIGKSFYEPFHMCDLSELLFERKINDYSDMSQKDKEELSEIEELDDYFFQKELPGRNSGPAESCYEREYKDSVPVIYDCILKKYLTIYDNRFKHLEQFKQSLLESDFEIIEINFT